MLPSVLETSGVRARRATPKRFAGIRDAGTRELREKPLTLRGSASKEAREETARRCERRARARRGFAAESESALPLLVRCETCPRSPNQTRSAAQRWQVLQLVSTAVLRK